MARQRVTAVRKRRSIEITDREFAYLSDVADYESRDGNSFAMLDLLYPVRGGETLRVKWGAVRDEIMSRWVAERPGTRPRAWWLVDAPRWDDSPDDYDRTLTQPRRRLGGTGTPIFECLCYVPHFEYGIPDTFISASTLAHYNEHGKNRGLKNWERPDEPVEAIDPKDPPQYESQARYLWDRDLLEPEEKRAVKKLGLLDEVELVERHEDELDEVTRRQAS